MNAPDRNHIFEYFPGNFVWSQSFMSIIDMAQWGASSMGEVDQVGRRLKLREGDNEAWFEEWHAMGEEMERKAEAARDAKHPLTAGTYYLHAGVYMLYAERFIPPSDRKFNSYRRAMKCFEEGFKRRYPNVERVEVPYEGQMLPAYFMKATTPIPTFPLSGKESLSPASQGAGASSSPPQGEGQGGGGSRRPTVVCFDGLDLCKEMSILFAGVELANRGISTLAIDGPGQGEALRLRGMPSRYDYEVPGTAAYECMAARSDVDPKRIAVMAFSMGGYYAPRIAAFEKRYAACIAWGAHFDYHAVWVDRWKHMQEGGKNASSAAFQLPWVLGTADMDSAMEKVKDFKLAGVAEKIECPTLIVHGENDTIVPAHWAEKLYAAVGAKHKELKIFTPADGGSEHCHGDNRIVGANYIADWVADNL